MTTHLPLPARAEDPPLSEFPQIRDMVTYAARAGSEVYVPHGKERDAGYNGRSYWENVDCHTVH